MSVCIYLPLSLSLSLLSLWPEGPIKDLTLVAALGVVGRKQSVSSAGIVQLTIVKARNDVSSATFCPAPCSHPKNHVTN